MHPLDHFIDNKDVGNQSDLKALNTTELKNVHSAYKAIKSSGFNPRTEKYVLNIGGTSPHYNYEYSPCLTRSRCASRGYWLSWLQRKIKVSEMWRLQGIPIAAYNKNKNLLSDAQLGKIIGNAIPIPLLASVLREMLSACDL